MKRSIKRIYDEELQKMCTVSVLMSVYNEKNEYLIEALESILHQTFQDFEVLIYDDDTSIENKKILAQYAAGDHRIRIISNPKNFGLTYNLAQGIHEAKGKYIARMDSDDISKLYRLKRQVQYMEHHSDVALLTTKVQMFGENIRNRSPLSVRLFSTSQYLKASLLFNNGLPHPTAMIRTSFLMEHSLNYDPKIKKSQDYDLWVHIARNGRIAFSQKPLVYYRIHNGQISNDVSGEQRFYANLIRLQQLTDLGIQLSPEEKELYLTFCDGKSGWKVWKNRNIIWNIRNKIIQKNYYSNFWIKYLFWKRLIRNCIT